MKVAGKREAIKTGFMEALPLAVAIAAYGLSYGVLATQVHFSVMSCVAMSLLVFSGSVQMVTVAMLTTGASMASVLVTSAVRSGPGRRDFSCKEVEMAVVLRCVG